MTRSAHLRRRFTHGESEFDGLIWPRGDGVGSSGRGYVSTPPKSGQIRPSFSDERL